MTHATDDPFAITEAPHPTTPGAADADLRAAYADAVVRCGKLQGRYAEAAAAAEKGERKLLTELLAVADALETITTMPDGEAQSTAVAATLKLLLRTLSRRGVARVDVVGRLADPDLVDIDTTETYAAYPEETVLRELVPTYRRDATVLRRGVVVVSCLPGSIS